MRSFLCLQISCRASEQTVGLQQDGVCSEQDMDDPQLPEEFNQKISLPPANSLLSLLRRKRCLSYYRVHRVQPLASSQSATRQDGPESKTYR